MKPLTAFLGGAALGAIAALLLAPEKGEDLRQKIVDILRKHGCTHCDEEIDAIVEEITEQVSDNK